jgi:transcriptional regulator with XRE-family HTH domain
MTIGDNIKRFRKERNITQSEFAQKAEISQSYLSDLENNRKNISTKTLENLAEKFNVSTTYLTTGNKLLTDLTEDERQNQFIEIANENAKKQLKKENDIKNKLFELLKKDLNFLEVHYLNSAYNFLQEDEKSNVFFMSNLLQLVYQEKGSNDVERYEDIKNEFDEFLKKYLAIK